MKLRQGAKWAMMSTQIGERLQNLAQSGTSRRILQSSWLVLLLCTVRLDYTIEGFGTGKREEQTSWKVEPLLNNF